MAHRYIYRTAYTHYHKIEPGDKVIIDTNELPKHNELGLFLDSNNNEVIAKQSQGFSRSIGKVIFINKQNIVGKV